MLRCDRTGTARWLSVGLCLLISLLVVAEPNGHMENDMTPSEIHCITDYAAYCLHRHPGVIFTDGCRDCLCGKKDVKCRKGPCAYTVHEHEDPVSYCQNIAKENDRKYEEFKEQLADYKEKMRQQHGLKPDFPEHHGPMEGPPDHRPQDFPERLQKGPEPGPHDLSRKRDGPKEHQMQPPFNGPPEPHGGPGPHGPPGQNGPLGPKNIPGPHGPPEPHGPPGHPGPPGPNGPPGPMVRLGPKNIPGPHGPPEPHGPPGPHGPLGKMALLGPKNTPELHGPPDLHLIPGPPSHPGNNDHPGPHGPPEPHNLPGFPGPPGPHGPLGPMVHLGPKNAPEPHGPLDLHIVPGPPSHSEKIDHPGPHGPLEPHNPPGLPGPPGPHDPLGPMVHLGPKNAPELYGSPDLHLLPGPPSHPGNNDHPGPHGPIEFHGPTESHGPSGPSGPHGPLLPIAMKLSPNNGPTSPQGPNGQYGPVPVSNMISNNQNNIPLMFNHMGNQHGNPGGPLTPAGLKIGPPMPPNPVLGAVTNKVWLPPPPPPPPSPIVPISQQMQHGPPLIRDFKEQMPRFDQGGYGSHSGPILPPRNTEFHGAPLDFLPPNMYDRQMPRFPEEYPQASHPHLGLKGVSMTYDDKLHELLINENKKHLNQDKATEKVLTSVASHLSGAAGSTTPNVNNKVDLNAAANDPETKKRLRSEILAELEAENEHLLKEVTDVRHKLKKCEAYRSRYRTIFSSGFQNSGTSVLHSKQPPFYGLIGLTGLLMLIANQLL